VEANDPLHALLALSSKARCASAAELPFLIVNESRALVEYRQSALAIDRKIVALSGLAQPELNAPYVQWLQQLCAYLNGNTSHHAVVLTSRDVPPELAAQWGEWLPAFIVWVPLAHIGAALFARDSAWDDHSLALLTEWSDVWAHAWRASQPKKSWTFDRALGSAKTLWKTRMGAPWWRQPRVWIAAIIIAVLLFPVRLSVLAPAELVPAHPEAIRAPLDGVIGQFHVEPNQSVTQGQLLFEFDDASLKAQAQVAQQVLATAEAEYRQNASLAVADNRSKAQLAPLLGKIAEKRAELNYLQGQIERARVLAPKAGIAVFDDPSEWVGRPVQTGERILRIADATDIEIEAWLPLGDALIFPDAADVQMYPSATPLHSLAGHLRYFAFEAQARPDGNYAYRLRATLTVSKDTNAARLGQKGTVRIYADRVPLIYWVIRRPLAMIRQYLGF
jgi:hypothetical protein